MTNESNEPEIKEGVRGSSLDWALLIFLCHGNGDWGTGTILEAHCWTSRHLEWFPWDEIGTGKMTIKWKKEESKRSQTSWQASQLR